MDLAHALGIALSAADQARTVVQQAFGRTQPIYLKHDRSPFTDADLAAERVIRATLSAAFPDHAIVGEELGAERVDSEYCWMVDPIDGTVSFINGLPFSASLIALCHLGQPQVAVVDFPMLDRRVTAVLGGGAWMDGQKLTVQEGFDPETSIVCHGDLYTFALGGHASLYRQLEDELKFFRSYTDAFGHYLVCTGAASVVVDSAMEVWDAAAPKLIVQEAGGTVACFNDVDDAHRLLMISGDPAGVAWVSQRAELSGAQRIIDPTVTC